MATNWLAATVRVKDGMQQQFEEAVKSLVVQVRANEPDVPTYTLTRNKADPTEYVFIEHYRTAEARAAHMVTDYFLAAKAQFEVCLDGKPTLADLETVM